MAECWQKRRMDPDFAGRVANPVLMAPYNKSSRTRDTGPLANCIETGSQASVEVKSDCRHGNDHICGTISCIHINEKIGDESKLNTNQTSTKKTTQRSNNRKINNIEIPDSNSKLSLFDIMQQQHHHEPHQKRHRRSSSTSQWNNNKVARNSINPMLIISFILLVASALASKAGLFCVCDSQQESTTTSSSSLTISNNDDMNHPMNQHDSSLAKKQHNNQKISIIKTVSPQTKRYKDKLITYLTDEIERKHFSLAGAKNGRPSKFDSGQEIDFIQLAHDDHRSGNQLNKVKSTREHYQMMDSIMQQHYSGQAPGNSKIGIKTGSDSLAMSDIMRMHELANVPTIKQQQQPLSISSSSKQSRAISPVKLMASFMGGSSNSKLNSVSSSSSSNSLGGNSGLVGPSLAHKMMSNLLNNYVSPYILGVSQAKLSQYADPSTIELVQKQQSPITNVISDISQTTSDEQQQTSSNRIISSIVGVGRSKAGFKFPGNPVKMLMSSSASYLLPSRNPHHTPSNYHRPVSSTTIAPLISSISDLKDPLEPAESSNLFSGQSGLMSATNSPSVNGGDSSTSDVTTSDPSGSISSVSTNNRVIRQQTIANKWFKNSMMSNFVQGSLRDILALTQLPIGGAGGVATNGLGSASGGHLLGSLSSAISGRPGSVKKISTAPSVLESNSKHKLNNHEMALGSRIIEELLRFAYIISSGVKTKRDPYVALVNSPIPSSSSTNPSSATINEGASGTGSSSSFSQRSTNPIGSLTNKANNEQSQTSALINGQLAQKIKSVLMSSSSSQDFAINKARPRGIMWEMATDPSLAVTVFHLLERASVAVPLGFLLLPFVKMIRSPLAGLDFGRLLAPRATHRSVELEELAKRLELVDKMLSRALRPTHRDATFMAG